MPLIAAGGRHYLSRCCQCRPIDRTVVSAQSGINSLGGLLLLVSLFFSSVLPRELLASGSLLCTTSVCDILASGMVASSTSERAEATRCSERRTRTQPSRHGRSEAPPRSTCRVPNAGSWHCVDRGPDLDPTTNARRRNTSIRAILQFARSRTEVLYAYSESI